MLTLCRASDRWVASEAFCTFGHGPEARARAHTFFGLTALVEVRLPPSAPLSPVAYGDVDLVTYVKEGSIAFDDPDGRPARIRVGEVHRQTGSAGVRPEANASSTSWAHVFRIGLATRDSVAQTDGPLLFTVAQRRNRGCVIASGDPREGTLRLRSNARVYSSILDPGHHLVHTLAEARSGWVQMVFGEASVNGVTLAGGDGVGVVGEPAISMTAIERTELLLIDVEGSRSVTAGAPA